MTSEKIGRAPYRATGYRMINSLQIKNFRCFKRANLKDCARVNVVVGDNGAGKTALLEGIFLAAGPSPEIVFRTRAWRGFEAERLRGSPEQVDRALWGDLFHNFNLKDEAWVSLSGSKDHNRSVSVTFRDRRSALVALNRKSRRAGATRDTDPPAVEFRWKAPGAVDLVIEPRLEEGQIRLPPVAESLVRSTFFAANRTYSSIETAQRFSRLSQAYQSEEFVEMFREHFPEVGGLSIEVSAGAPMLYCHLKGVSEKIPLSLASGGMNKLAAILLAPAADPGGVVLVDEIESGFYHNRLEAIWASMRDLAERYDSQIFASTHSAECLRAAANLARSYPDDFSIIKPTNAKGETTLRHFASSKLITAMEENLEIR